MAEASENPSAIFLLCLREGLTGPWSASVHSLPQDQETSSTVLASSSRHAVKTFPRGRPSTALG